MYLKQIADSKRISENMRNQGKSDKEIKQAISLYLSESKNKINAH
ncbi:hypothetical protein QA612_09840 [Evansella sp. AB-P1]|nr:hypothetical protein [Evansella sp. AB-P1]MDG5787800.1 hypothetical protein [Evansella sp. AB-P1]